MQRAYEVWNIIILLLKAIEIIGDKPWTHFGKGIHDDTAKVCPWLSAKLPPMKTEQPMQPKFMLRIMQ